MDKIPDLKTFEEYWASTPGFQGVEMLPAHLVLVIAASSFAAGQSNALEWSGAMMKSLGKTKED